MKKLVLKNASLLLVALFFAANSFAQMGNEGGKQFKDGMHQKHGKCMKIPDLTKEQKKQMKKIHTAAMKEMLPLRNELKEKEAHLQTVSTGENVKLNEVYAVIDEISTLKIKMAKQRAAKHQEVRKLLTDDQRIWFDMHAPQKKGMKCGKKHDMKKADCQGK